MSLSTKAKKLSLNEHHPFAQGLFDDFQDYLATGFANQSKELSSLSKYVKRSRLLGVQGPLGSGKTTLLSHFCSTQLLPNNPVVFLQLCSEAYPRPFSQIASAVLRLCGRSKKKGKIKINSSFKMNFTRERKRLEGELRKDLGLKVEIAPEVEIPNLLKLKVGSISAEQIVGNTAAQYEDSAAVALLKELFHNSETRFFVILDDFHYLRRHRQNEDYYLDFISFTDTVSRVLRHRNVTFILTLDDVVLKKRKEAEQSGGGKARAYTDEEMEVTGFSPASIAEMIDRRLALFNYPDGKPPSFFDEAILATCLASKGNPRIALDVLRHSMDHAEDDRTEKVSLEHVKAAAHELRDVTINETDIKILAFLRDHGPASPVDEALQKSVGKSRQTLQRHLPALEDLGVLISQTGGDAKNPRTEYNIPTISRSPV